MSHTNEDVKVDVDCWDINVHTRQSVLVAHCASLCEPVVVVSAKKHTNRLMIWKGLHTIDDGYCPIVKEYVEENGARRNMGKVALPVCLHVYANLVPGRKRNRVPEPNIAGPPAADDDGEVCKCHCGNDTEGEMVRCEECDTWQHVSCFYESAEKIPALHCCSLACQDKYLEEKRLAKRRKSSGNGQETNPVNIKDEDGEEASILNKFMPQNHPLTDQSAPATSLLNKENRGGQKTNPVFIKDEDCEEESVFNRALPQQLSLIDQSVTPTSSLTKENRGRHLGTPATSTSNTYLPSPIPSVLHHPAPTTAPTAPSTTTFAFLDFNHRELRSRGLDQCDKAGKLFGQALCAGLFNHTDQDVKLTVQARGDIAKATIVVRGDDDDLAEFLDRISRRGCPHCCVDVRRLHETWT